MRIFCVVLLLILNQVLRAQSDTLVTRKGERVPVVLVKVGRTSVKCLKISGADTLTVEVDKNDIDRIRYANGLVETIEFDAYREAARERKAEREKKKTDTTYQKELATERGCLSVGPSVGAASVRGIAPGANLGILMAVRNWAFSATTAMHLSNDSSNEVSVGFVSINAGRAFRKPHFLGSITTGLSFISLTSYNWVSYLDSWHSQGHSTTYWYHYKQNVVQYSGIAIPLELKCFWFSKKGLGAGFTFGLNYCPANKTTGFGGACPPSLAVNFVYHFTAANSTSQE